MLKQFKSLLSVGSVDRDALTHIDHNIKPRLTQGLNRGLRRFTNTLVKLSITGIIFLFLYGLSPVIPFIPQTQALAQDNTLNQKYSLPHNGYISTYFSSIHPGVDIATDLNTVVHPINEGVIEAIEYGNTGYGNHITILHSNGIRSLYAHLGNIYVKKDQSVTITTEIGTVGISGHSSGPHTHLEITKDGSLIDPITLLPQITTLAVLAQSNAVGGNPVIKQPEPKIDQKPTELRKTLQVDAN